MNEMFLCNINDIAFLFDVQTAGKITMLEATLKKENDVLASEIKKIASTEASLSSADNEFAKWAEFLKAKQMAAAEANNALKNLK